MLIMPVEVGISMAASADMEGIATVLLRAMEPEPIDRFMVPIEGFEAAYTAKMEWAEQTFPKDMADPNKRIFRASLKASDHIVGFGVITYYDENFGNEQQERAPNAKQEEPNTNTILEQEKAPDFAPFYFASMSAIHEKHMRGQKHVGKCFIFRNAFRLSVPSH